MNNYNIATLVRCAAVVQDLSGNPITPSIISAKLLTPANTIIDMSASVVTDSVGNFHFDYTPTIRGVHSYEYLFSGTAIISATGQFNVASGF